MRAQLIAAAVFIALTGAASAETRDVTGFTGVSASDRIRVIVAVGESYRVDVTGSEADKVSTRVNDDGTLLIRRTNRRFWGGTPAIDATVRIAMPRVESLGSSRGAELSATGVTAQAMSLAASMGGELEVAGVCNTLEAAASMGGVIDAEALQCENADVSASMGGEARVYASDRIDVAATMGGAVQLAGGGRNGDVALSMGGTLDRD
ncbi:MAG: DUF2807 domain-containing protein [Hyphomonadaceae bacterium]